MTLLQVEIANKIISSIEELKNFKSAFENKTNENIIKASYFKEFWDGSEKEEKFFLNLENHPKLQEMIGNYISEKIKELEDQLEEL